MNDDDKLSNVDVAIDSIAPSVDQSCAIDDSNVETIYSGDGSRLDTTMVSSLADNDTLTRQTDVSLANASVSSTLTRQTDKSKSNTSSSMKSNTSGASAKGIMPPPPPPIPSLSNQNHVHNDPNIAAISRDNESIGRDSQNSSTNSSGIQANNSQEEYIGEISDKTENDITNVNTNNEKSDRPMGLLSPEDIAKLLIVMKEASTESTPSEKVNESNLKAVEEGPQSNVLQGNDISSMDSKALDSDVVIELVNDSKNVPIMDNSPLITQHQDNATTTPTPTLAAPADAHSTLSATPNNSLAGDLQDNSDIDSASVSIQPTEQPVFIAPHSLPTSTTSSTRSLIHITSPISTPESNHTEMDIPEQIAELNQIIAAPPLEFRDAIEAPDLPAASIPLPPPINSFNVNGRSSPNYPVLTPIPPPPAPRDTVHSPISPVQYPVSNIRSPQTPPPPANVAVGEEATNTPATSHYPVVIPESPVLPSTAKYEPQLSTDVANTHYPKDTTTETLSKSSDPITPTGTSEYALTTHYPVIQPITESHSDHSNYIDMQGSPRLSDNSEPTPTTKLTNTIGTNTSRPTSVTSLLDDLDRSSDQITDVNDTAVNSKYGQNKPVQSPMHDYYNLPTSLNNTKDEQSNTDEPIQNPSHSYYNLPADVKTEPGQETSNNVAQNPIHDYYIFPNTSKDESTQSTLDNSQSTQRTFVNVDVDDEQDKISEITSLDLHPQQTEVQGASLSDTNNEIEIENSENENNPTSLGVSSTETSDHVLSENDAEKSQSENQNSAPPLQSDDSGSSSESMQMYDSDTSPAQTTEIYKFMAPSDGTLDESDKVSSNHSENTSSPDLQSEKRKTPQEEFTSKDAPTQHIDNSHSIIDADIQSPIDNNIDDCCTFVAPVSPPLRYETGVGSTWKKTASDAYNHQPKLTSVEEEDNQTSLKDEQPSVENNGGSTNDADENMMITDVTENSDMKSDVNSEDTLSRNMDMQSENNDDETSYTLNDVDYNSTQPTAVFATANQDPNSQQPIYNDMDNCAAFISGEQNMGIAVLAIRDRVSTDEMIDESSGGVDQQIELDNGGETKSLLGVVSSTTEIYQQHSNDSTNTEVVESSKANNSSDDTITSDEPVESDVTTEDCDPNSETPKIFSESETPDPIYVSPVASSTISAEDSESTILLSTTSKDVETTRSTSELPVNCKESGEEDDSLNFKVPSPPKLPSNLFFLESEIAGSTNEDKPGDVSISVKEMTSSIDNNNNTDNNDEDHSIKHESAGEDVNIPIAFGQSIIKPDTLANVKKPSVSESVTYEECPTPNRFKGGLSSVEKDNSPQVRNIISLMQMENIN